MHYLFIYLFTVVIWWQRNPHIQLPNSFASTNDQNHVPEAMQTTMGGYCIWHQEYVVPSPVHHTSEEGKLRVSFAVNSKQF